jgi:hypothetical protein
MIRKILTLLKNLRKPVVSLNRREPYLGTPSACDTVEAQMEPEFSRSRPSASLNPVYLQGIRTASEGPDRI